MQPTEFNIELLPKDGRFVITLEGKDGQEPRKIKGRFSMYALDRFCAFMKLNYLQAVMKISMGFTIKQYATLVLYGLQDYYREDVDQCPWDEVKIMDEVFDGAGGFGSEQLKKLFAHAIGRLTTVVEDAESIEADKNMSEDEKKSVYGSIAKELVSSIILTSEDDATRQDARQENSGTAV